MITAKQAREKQLTTNWRDNERLAKIFDEAKEMILKEIEEGINEALLDFTDSVDYSISYESVYDLKLVTNEVRYNFLHKELTKEIEKELSQLGYNISLNSSGSTCAEFWTISW